MTDAGPERAPRTRSAWGFTLLGVLVSVALLWWAGRGLDLSTVVTQLGRVPIVTVVATVIVATLMFPMRMFRWRFLLRVENRPIGYGPAWHSIALGFMSNNLLLLRAGEFVRSYAASRLGNLPLASTLASVAVERVFDTITVVATLVVILVMGVLPESTMVGGMPVDLLARRVATIGAVALALAASVLAFPTFFRATIVKLVPLPKIADRLVRLLDEIRAGIASLRSPTLLLAVVAWSAAIWLVNALSFFILFPAFGIHLGFGAALLMQAAIVFSIAVPSSPGYVGVFEAAIVASLGLYGIPQEQAFAYAVTYHVTTFLPITLLGLYSLIRTPLQWSELRRKPAPPTP